MTVGATLKRARETRGLTREAVARATRIPVRLIAAIEEENWAALPGGVFRRGYLRACAREVGIDSESLVSQYDAEHAPSPVQAAEPPASVTDERWHFTAREAWWRPTNRAWTRLAWPSLTAAALIFYFTVGRLPGGADPSERRGADAEPRAAATTSALGRQPDAPVGTTSAVEGTSGPVDAPLAMELTVSRPCWLTVTVDGSRRIYRLVKPGDRERQAGRQFVIHAGDAGALQLSFDGESAWPIGLSGQVVTVRIGRDNYRSLLKSPSPR